MNKTLLPCPFCGGEAMLEFTKERKGLGAAVACGCSANIYTVTLDTEAEAEAEAIAAWNRRIDARQLALKTRVCPMCEDCPDGCPVETPKDSRNIVTNADRIRSMSDKEFAEYIFYLGNGSEYCYGHCAYQDDCATKGLDHDTCIKGVIDWLKQPLKEE